MQPIHQRLDATEIENLAWTIAHQPAVVLGRDVKESPERAIPAARAAF